MNQSLRCLLSWIMLVHLLYQVEAISRNTTVINPRTIDGGYQTSSSIMDRQFPGDSSFLVPQLIMGMFIPVAIIIAIGILLIKMFVIGFMLLGRGGYGGYGGFGQGVYGQGGYGGLGGAGGTSGYPWRADQQQQTARSLLDKNGNSMPPFLSSTLLSLIEKVTTALDKYDTKSQAKRN